MKPKTATISWSAQTSSVQLHFFSWLLELITDFSFLDTDVFKWICKFSIRCKSLKNYLLIYSILNFRSFADGKWSSCLFQISNFFLTIAEPSYDWKIEPPDWKMVQRGQSFPCYELRSADDNLDHLVLHSYISNVHGIRMEWKSSFSFNVVLFRYSFNFLQSVT